MSSAATMEEYLDISDLSDKEDAEQLDLSPFPVDWLDFNVAECKKTLGICSLPGCKYKNTWRSLSYDIKCLKDKGVQDVFCFCTNGELHLYRVHGLMEKYKNAGFTVHHKPIEDGQLLPIEDLVKILEEIVDCLTNDKKTVIHCYGGLGRSCFIAICLSIFLNESINIEETREKIKQLRGEGALGSVKQFNFVNEFKENLEVYRKIKIKENGERSASR